MSDSFGSRGWEQPGINPFEMLQGHITKSMKKSKKRASAPEPTVKQEPPARYDPLRRGVEMMRENNSHAESVRRNAEASQVYAEKRVQPHRVEQNTPGVDSKRSATKPSGTGPTRVSPGKGQSEYGPPQPKSSTGRRVPGWRGA